MNNKKQLNTYRAVAVTASLSGKNFRNTVVISNKAMKNFPLPHYLAILAINLAIIVSIFFDKVIFIPIIVVLATKGPSIKLKPCRKVGFTQNFTDGSCEDINECQNGDHSCIEEEICRNIPGFFDCVCDCGEELRPVF